MEHTREQIEQMPAGQELDDVIAQAFFGYVPVWMQFQHGGAENLLIQPNEVGFYRSYFKAHDGWNQQGQRRQGGDKYSSDIARAFELVEKFGSSHSLSVSQFFLTGGSDGGTLGWRAGFSQLKTYKCLPVKADTLPLAICRAALLTTLAAL